MRKWTLAIIVINAGLAILLTIVLFIVTIAIPSLLEPLALITPAVFAATNFILTLIATRMFTGPLTKTAWKAEDASRLMLLLMGRDGTITPVLPSVTGSILEFKIAGSPVIYYLHPQSVLAVPNSGARLVLAHVQNSSTITPQAAIIAFDIRYVKGYDHAAHYVSYEPYREQLKEITTKYETLLALARESVEDDKAFEKNKKTIIKLLNELGYRSRSGEVSLSDVIGYAEYNLKILEAMKKANEEGTDGIISPALLKAIKEEPTRIKIVDLSGTMIRTITPSEVESILVTYSMPHFIRHLYERAFDMALQKMRRMMPMGVDMRTLMFILLAFIIIIAIAMALSGGGGLPTIIPGG